MKEIDNAMLNLLLNVIEENKEVSPEDSLLSFLKSLGAKKRQAKKENLTFASFLVPPGRARVYIRFDSAKFLLDISEERALSWATAAAAMGAAAWVLILRTRKTKTGRRIPMTKKVGEHLVPIYRRLFPDGVSLSEAKAVELEQEFAEITPQSASALSGISNLLEQIPGPGWAGIQPEEKKVPVVEKVPSRRVAPDASWMTKKGWNFGSATTIRKEMAPADPVPRVKKPRWVWWLDELDVTDVTYQEKENGYQKTYFLTPTAGKAWKIKAMAEENGEKNVNLSPPKNRGVETPMYKVSWG